MSEPSPPAEPGPDRGPVWLYWAEVAVLAVLGFGLYALGIRYS